MRGHAGRPRLTPFVLLAMVAAACSHSSARRTPSASAGASTTAAPAAVYPLTGLPADDPGRLGRPAVIVKIENEPPARPQSGLQSADVVYEEQIEGGDTRFVAIFQSTDADPVGSIRSVRPTDPGVVAPIGGLFAYSGGTPKFVAAIRAAHVVDVGDSTTPGAYFIRPEKSSDHKLFSSTARLYAAAHGAAPPPPRPLFPFLRPGVAFNPAGASPATHVDTAVGTQRISYDWDGAAGWRRSINGRPHTVEGAGQLAPTNVIVQSVSWSPSPGDTDVLGSQVFVAQLVGSGDAWIFSGGRVVKVRWSKAGADAVTTYAGSDGQPVALTPGRTWVELAGTGAPPTVR